MVARNLRAGNPRVRRRGQHDGRTRLVHHRQPRSVTAATAQRPDRGTARTIRSPLHQHDARRRLEWYEQGDVWHRVITEEHRSAVSDVPTDLLDARAQEIRPLLFADSNVLLRPGGLLEPVSDWADAFRSAGQKLRHAVQDGTLDRGLRQVLSYHVIFHWNRLGLSLRSQSVLAWAARAAILHGENGT